MASSDDPMGTGSELTLSELREESERVRAMNQAEVLVIVELLKEISLIGENKQEEEEVAEVHAAERKKLEQQIKDLCAEIKFLDEGEFEELEAKRLGEQVRYEQLKKQRIQAKRRKANAYRPNPPRR